MNNPVTERTVALITGASSGLGEALARKFHTKGITVVGVSRHKPEVVSGQWVQADITKPSDREKLLKTLTNKFGRLDVLVNCAGKGSYATWEELAESELRDIFELNFFAVANLTQELLPLLKQSQGTIINISSVAGKMHVPCMGAYCATKFAVCAYSDSLRAEVKTYGVNVINALPGRVNTGFSTRAVGLRKPPETPNGGTNATTFADILYRGWRKRRKNVFYPRWYRLVIWLARTFPGIYDYGNIKIWKLDKRLPLFLLATVFLLYTSPIVNARVFSLMPRNTSGRNSGRSINPATALTPRNLLTEPMVINGASTTLSMGLVDHNIFSVLQILHHLFPQADYEINANTVLAKITVSDNVHKRLLLISFGTRFPILQFAMTIPPATTTIQWPKHLPLPSGSTPKRYIHFPQRNSWYGSFTTTLSPEQALAEVIAKLGADGWKPVEGSAVTNNCRGKFFMRKKPLAIMQINFANGIGVVYFKNIRR